MSNKTKNIALIFILVIIVLTGIFLGNKYSAPKIISTQTATSTIGQKCPENYTTDEERNIEYKSFTTDFLASHPQGTVADLAQARTNFLTENNCIKTLKYIQDNGGVEQYTKTITDDLVATNTPTVSKAFNYIPDTAQSMVGDSFKNVGSADLNIISIAPSIGFKTGISQYPTLTWKTEYTNMKELGINIDVQYPQFSSGNAITDLDLNQYINTIITEQIEYDRVSMKKWSMDNDDIDLYGDGFDLAIRYRVIGVVNGIVSIEMVSTDFTGGGTGNHDEPYTINWDLKSDRLLNFSDVFCATDYLHALKPLVDEELVSTYSQDDTVNDPSDWQYFLLYKNGIIVIFPPYDVTSGAYGIIRVFIPDSKNSPLLCLP